MNILHVVPTLSPTYGGPSATVLGMCGSLNSHGINTAIASTSSSLPAVQYNVAVHEFPREFQAVLPSDFSYSPMFDKWLRKNMHQYDLVHVHTLFTYTTAQACWVARKHKIPYVLRPCGMLSSVCLQRSPIKKSIWMKVKEMENINNAAALHFTTGNEQQGAEFIKFARPAVVIPPGFIESPVKRCDKYTCESDASKESFGLKRILFLSRFHPIKGLDLLIPALGLIAKRRSDFVFILAGDGQPRDVSGIKRLLLQHNLLKSTVMTGFVTGTTKSSLLASADIFVLPSYHENFGMSVVEAMASGIAVVISNHVDLCLTTLVWSQPVMLRLLLKQLRNYWTTNNCASSLGKMAGAWLEPNLAGML
jgi:glycosyltransferase involved in cell wall biosynthesis